MHNIIYVYGLVTLLIWFTYKRVCVTWVHKSIYMWLIQHITSDLILNIE